MLASPSFIPCPCFVGVDEPLRGFPLSGGLFLFGAQRLPLVCFMNLNYATVARNSWRLPNIPPHGNLLQVPSQKLSKPKDWNNDGSLEVVNVDARGVTYWKAGLCVPATLLCAASLFFCLFILQTGAENLKPLYCGSFLVAYFMPAML